MGQQRKRQHFGGAMLRDEAGRRNDRIVGVAADRVGCVIAVFDGQNRGQVPDIGTPGVASYV